MTRQAGDLEGPAHEKYRSRASKVVDIRAINTRIFYNLIGLKSILSNIIFVELISNYDIVFHIIDFLSLQRSNIPKEPIRYTLTTLQDMHNYVRAAFSDSTSRYVGDECTVPLPPPLPQKDWVK